MKDHQTTRRTAPTFALAWAAGLGLAVLTVVFSLVEDIPIRDPDNVLPGYIRFPAIVLGAIALDVVPRTLLAAGRPGGGWLRRLGSTGRTVVRERWPLAHWKFALNGVIAWYLCYAAFRNVKSMAPFVHEKIYDAPLSDIDRFLFAGHDPAATLHAWFGTGIAAHVLSAVYIIWIALVPVSIAIALVWTRHTRAGEWFVTAVAVDWALGAVLYVLLPTVGPIYSDPRTFASLPSTHVSQLQESLWTDRVAVMADPVAAGTLQTVAAFASLHVGIMVTICLVVELVRLPRWVRVSSWVFLALTCVSTVYFGWHFVVDVLGGFALGAAAVWIAGMATGNRIGWRARLVPERVEEPAGEPVSVTAESASPGHPGALASRSAPLPDHPAGD
ncbi:PAP2 superfamily protein [Nocardioides sp. J9]|uniref:phosphatase PAP2 family protein n=1 Tax=unclassified Nocardioides TaxID=2615069 RepID=UPI0011AAC515|nr:MULTISPECIES: phosphatase PAP2 family protein [unclassified Nocardioides]TWH00724.1 PAP2 superfamily protein [Nocardioides sp. J9]